MGERLSGRGCSWRYSWLAGDGGCGGCGVDGDLDGEVVGGGGGGAQVEDAHVRVGCYAGDQVWVVRAEGG